jgi:hypothetical protein
MPLTSKQQAAMCNYTAPPPAPPIAENLLPCCLPCPKCGSADVHRRFFRKGQDTNCCFSSDGLESTQRVDRSDTWFHPALVDCLVHHCRVCTFVWETDTLDKEKSV